jgi:hypothetical protein
MTKVEEHDTALYTRLIIIPIFILSIFLFSIRLLLAPVRFSAQAISWVSGRLEPNKIGLPTSPSTSAAQNQVLQAAAKHGSQPAESEESAPS